MSLTLSTIGVKLPPTETLPVVEILPMFVIPCVDELPATARVPALINPVAETFPATD